MHVLIDSNIYRGDRKRNKPAFRAILRLAKAGKLHLHVPFFVKAEVLSQLQNDVRSEINKIRSAAHEILSLTTEANLKGQARLHSADGSRDETERRCMGCGGPAGLD
jgi:hypothetical protein